MIGKFGLGEMSDAAALQLASEYIRGNAPYGASVCGPNTTPENNGWLNDPVALKVAEIPHARPGVNDPYYNAGSPVHVSADSWAYYWQMVTGTSGPTSAALGIPNTVGLTLGQYYHLINGGKFDFPPATCYQGNQLIPSEAAIAKALADVKSGRLTVYLNIPAVTTPANQTPAQNNVNTTQAATSGGKMGTLTFHNSRGSNVLLPGDTWTITIEGSYPNAAVYVVGGKNGESIKSPMGSTNASGGFSLSGTLTSGDVGTWSETWIVHDVTIGTFTFTVQLPTSNSTNGQTSGGTFQQVDQEKQKINETNATQPDISTLLNDSLSIAGYDIPYWAVGLAAVGVIGYFMMGSRR
jgi:hypothetical protein